MKSLQALLFLLTLTISLHAQSTAKSPEIPSIEVTGRAEKEVVPDEIYIAITLHEWLDGKEKVTIAQQETALKEGLLSLGISLDNLFLANANADYIRVKRLKKARLTKTKYQLKVGNAATVGKVFDQLETLNINDARIASVYHSKLPELKKEVRIMAIKAAKEKADYLLEAIGQETGTALKVQEQPTSNYDSSANLNIRGSRSDANYVFIDGVKVPLDTEPAIQFKKIKLQANMYVKFEIK